jgi:hypothetical protein
MMIMMMMMMIMMMMIIIIIIITISSKALYVQIFIISNCNMDTRIKSVQIVIKILLITWSKYSDVCFKLAMFCNICLLHDNVVTFYICDVFDVARVTVWLIGVNK